MNRKFWKDKKVFITGHTGFKGSWLSFWLNECGSKVKGYSLEPSTNPNLYDVLDLNSIMDSNFGDIRHLDLLEKSISEFKPEIVIHMAAQPLVRFSYIDPIETYSTNVMGTVNLLEACRKIESIKAVINVTTDKCYKNKEWFWGYREHEEMGGHDPYSNSKGCSELVTSAYRDSFFGDNHNISLASARAGNVIGGGDWAEDRLIPDIFKSIINKEKLVIRNPRATRPWQHVLEPLSGYLKLAECLYLKGEDFAQGWNFGPNDDDCRSVEEVISYLVPKLKEKLSYLLDDGSSSNEPHEAQLLKLDISKAKNYLHWHPRWNIECALDKVIEWHNGWSNNENIQELTLRQIEEYEKS